jgi:peptidoglycan/xylan/chitin deacetylase (PgdA/CDA1 family)
MYHRVVKRMEPHMLDKGLYISQQAFFENLQFLKKETEFIGLADWLNGNSKPGKYCIVTFDDGWRDNYEVAFPILTDLGVPATVFLTAKSIDSNDAPWFERLRFVLVDSFSNKQRMKYMATIFKKYGIVDNQSGTLSTYSLYYILRDRLVGKNPEYIDRLLTDLETNSPTFSRRRRVMLNWEELRDMSRRGITFGSHGLNHWAHPTLRTEERREEIYTSKFLLENAGINFVPAFSFPNGLIDMESLAMIRQAGYRGVFAASKKNVRGIDCDFLYSRVCLSQSVTGTDDLLAWRLAMCRLRKEFVCSGP